MRLLLLYAVLLNCTICTHNKTIIFNNSLKQNTYKHRFVYKFLSIQQIKRLVIKQIIGKSLQNSRNGCYII